MANRSYLYAIDFDRTKGERKRGEKVFGLSEYPCSIPLSYLILVSQNSKISPSIIWDEDEPVAIQGNFKKGRQKLMDFLSRLSSEAIFEKDELEKQIAGTKAFLDNHQLKNIILECGELYEMESEAWEEQNRRLFEEDIVRIDETIEEAIAELRQMKGVKNQEQEMWDRLGINDWSDTLYFNMENDAENDLSRAIKLIKECRETRNPFLDLGTCGITDLEELPELFECTHLETLILSDKWWNMHADDWEDHYQEGKSNSIAAIPKAISNLKNLTTLIAGDNRISDISPLENLTGIRYLDLGDNRISNISVLKTLTGLQYVRLGDNRISSIQPLENLTGIKYLYLPWNKISNISYLHALTGLEYLNLGGNKISGIGGLENLAGLKELHLFWNQISDIGLLGKLTGLQNLDLEQNLIKEVPLSIFRLNMESVSIDEQSSGGLCLYDNPIESPPKEIIRKGKQSVLEWFERNETTGKK